MRIILSHVEVNVFNLAKNAGTSVEQIERFYSRNLPLSAEMVENFQSFLGSDTIAMRSHQPIGAGNITDQSISTQRYRYRRHDIVTK